MSQRFPNGFHWLHISPSERAGFLVGTFLFITIFFSGSTLYLCSVSALREEVRNRVKGDAQLLSHLVDADTYQIASAASRRVLRARKNIQSVSVFVLRNGKIVVLDTIATQPITDFMGHGEGKPVTAPPPELLAALQTKTPQAAINPDEVLISGYAPLHGAVEGVIGVDIVVSDYQARLHVLQAVATMGLSAALAVSMGAGFVVRTLFAELQTTRQRLETAINEKLLALAKANDVLQEEVSGHEQTMLILRASEEHFAYQAFHDPLTGLPNRALFVDRLQRTLAQSAWSTRFVAVLFLDLNDFKVINDSLGHQTGDRLLMLAAERLQNCLRPGDTVARLGGDEFTVLLSGLDDQSEAVKIATDITEAFREPFVLQNREVIASVSIGVALSHDSDTGDSQSSIRLMRDADTAMYQAKREKNKNSVPCVVFERSMNQNAVERLVMEADLRSALLKNEFQVYYQPVVRLDTGHMEEMEALVRWLHPTQGIIAPDKFIPLAEETGLIVPLGKWVLETACRQAKIWHGQYANHLPLVVSVNLSGRQIYQADIVKTVVGVLQETGLPASCLRLELTESVMMADAETTIAKLGEIKKLGVHLAVDDFGTGYSSMAYLTHFPLDTFKIDRSFVSRLDKAHSDDAAIVRAMVTLAKTLKLRVTGEGVETEAQQKQLIALGCDYGQGYFFAPPLTPDAMGGMLSRLPKG